MTIYEWIGIGIAMISLVWSCITFFLMRNNATAQTELYINERITNTKEKVSEHTNEMAPLKVKKDLTIENQELLRIKEQILKTAIENNLNAYEEACAKYIDKKIDRKRFKKTYKIEIKQLVENKNFKSYFDKVTSPYKTILTVYNELKES
ncbi:MAG: hypothetical protein P9M06_02210 [Candidatus Saelkia tenebricola]|nr:hypothetical protein [Candidatus Saelkia tenebricola]